LLTRKYLTSKLMPILAMLAVMLSVATILITWSVMGGFLKTLVNSGRSLVGDVVITWPNVGFAHYDDLIERLESDPMIAAATPLIETFGLVQLPDDRIELISIKGIDPSSYGDVTNYNETIWWKPIEKPTPKDHDRSDVRLAEDLREVMAMFESNAMTLTRFDPASGETQDAGVLGIEVTGLNIRTADGIYDPRTTAFRALPDGGIERIPGFMPSGGSVGMTVLALDSRGRPVDPVTRTIPIANEFQSGIYEVDTSTMMVPLDVMQRMLRLDEARRVEVVESENPFEMERDPETGEMRPKRREVVGVDPARVTNVLVKAAPGVALMAAQERCKAIYAEFARAHSGEVPGPMQMENQIRTWEDLNATMINAVKKETGLVLFVFGIVSFTTVFLVLAIFWSMASEKTKDIGILRALGASTGGIAWLWIRYGTVIGLIGAVLGTGLGYVIVSNINAIHDWLGRTFGLTIWDPRQYYFIEIPSEVEVSKAVIVFVVGVLTCVLGSLLPAWRSAKMDPVKALRFE
jgi:lipoprotein-releasing system permease protein